MCSSGCILRWISVVSYNDLAPIRRQTIIRTNQLCLLTHIWTTRPRWLEFEYMCDSFVLVENHVTNHDQVWLWKHFPRNCPLCGEFTGPGEFPTQRLVTRRFDVFFDLRLNKRLSKQPWGWWFETPSCSLRLQCNGEWIIYIGLEYIYICCLQFSQNRFRQKVSFSWVFRLKNMIVYNAH